MVFWTIEAAFEELQHVTSVLGGDVEEISRRLTEAESQLERRNLVRAFFSLVEAQTYQLKKLGLLADRLEEQLSAGERAKHADRSQHCVSQRGRLVRPHAGRRAGQGALDHSDVPSCRL